MLPSQHNPAMQDIAQALGNSLDRDGRGGMRANLDMGGFKLANMAPGTASNDAATLAQASIPVGAVVDFAGNVAPQGYLFCYGQAVSRTTYAALFAAIGTLYGSGDGTTTFNLPDLRGVVIAGRGDMGGSLLGRLSNFASTVLGAVFGGQSHQLDTSEMPSHGHGVNDPGHAHALPDFAISGSGSGSGTAGGGFLGWLNRFNGTNSAFTGISLNNAGGGGAHNNVQPTFILNKIMKVSL